ncbi:MAG: hypothetical protein JWR80_10067 [Bradyrhizobium sp.]|nr:hypothetical protein [Bradyrhizobium sp.]
MRNRFLGGASFLPMFAPADKPGGGGQAELALDPAEIAAHGDPEFVDPPADAAAAVDDNDPNDVSGVGEEDPADEPAATPAVAAKPAAAAKVEEPAADEEDDEPKTPEEMKAALAQSKRAVKALTGRLATTAAEKRRLNEQLAATIKPVVEPAEGDPAAAAAPERADFASKADFEAAVRAEAARVRAVEAFNERCNDIEDKGSKTFGKKWTDAKAQLGILDDQGRIPFDLLNCAMETDNPAQVLFALGQNLDRATELLAMTPLKRAIAMSKMAETPKPAERPRSQTPPPVEPIGGRGGGDDKPSDRDTDEEWNRKEAAREAQVAAQRRARGY